MKHSKDLKATGGILVNGVMFLLSKTLESVDKKLTGGLVTEITGEISKNFVVSHFGTFGTYGKLYDLVQTPHPDNLNHDIERLIKEAALVAIDLLRTIYLEELANDAEFFKGIRHDEMKEYLSAIDIYFSNARSDIKGYIDIYKVDKKISDNPNQYFSKVSEYLITVSGIRFDKQSKFRIEEFHKKWLPFCFQLAFKEALKNDENGFKAFQLAFFEDLKGWQGITDRALSKIQKSIDRVKSGKVIFPAAKLDSIGLKLTNILNSHYTGIEAKLTALEQQIGSQFSDFYAFNSEVRADLVKLNNKSDELLDLSRRSVSTNSEILRKIQNLSSKRDLLISQKIFSGSTEVLEVVAEIESLPEQIKELNKKYVLYLEKYSKNSDYSDLVKISFENWKAATERLNYLIETLDNTKSTVVSLYHLLFKQKPVGKRSRTMKVAIKLFEDGKFSELEEFLSSEAREKERAIVLHEQHLIDKKKATWPSVIS